MREKGTQGPVEKREGEGEPGPGETGEGSGRVT